MFGRSAASQAKAYPLSVEPAAEKTEQAPDPLAALRMIKELRDAGVLTQEEFDSKKAQIVEKY